MSMRKHFGRYAVLALAALAGCLLWSGGPAGAETNFPQTGQSVWGPFEKYWTEHGGLAQFGMPRTSVYPAGKDYDAQWFERALFTYNPKNPDPYKVELQLLGAIVTESRRGEAPFKPAAKASNTAYFQQTSHNLSGKLLQYWQTTGGVAVYGYPISEPFEEQSKSDGKAYTVQYFERNRLELHPELAGSAFGVQLGLLGSELLDKQGGPAAFAKLGRPSFYPPLVRIPPGGIVEPPGSGTPEPTPTAFPTAPALPQTDRPLLYGDNFTDSALANWLPAALPAPPDAEIPRWRAKEGELQQIGDLHESGYGEDAFLMLKQPATAGNFTMDTYFRASSGEPVGLAFRYSNNSFYLLRLYGKNPNASAKAELLLVSPGKRAIVAQSTVWPGYARNNWQRLTVTAQGERITASVDGKVALQATDTALSQGGIGLYAFASGVARFDNFRLTAP